MPNPAPVARLRGMVHGNPVARHVPALEARPAAPATEPGGRATPAREARDGYDVYDVTVLTEGGGFASVVFREEAIATAEGYLPSAGDLLDGLPVYSYVMWNGPEGRRYTSVGYSFAGSVYAAESQGGKRAASAA